MAWIAGALVGGFVLGWAIATWMARARDERYRVESARRVAAAEAGAEAERARRLDAEAELDQATASSAELARDLAVATERLDSSQKALSDQLAFIESSKAQLEDAFEALAASALKGSTEEQAFYVKCDAETNPPEVQEAGMVVTEIGLAPAIPNEFVVVRLVHGAGGVTITT